MNLNNLRRAKLTLAPVRVYAIDEDPLAGVLMLRTWLEQVGGRWKGIGEQLARGPDAGMATVEQLLDELALNAEERQVLALQASGVRHLGICAATALSPRQVESRVSTLNAKIKAWAEGRKRPAPTAQK